MLLALFASLALAQDIDEEDLLRAPERHTIDDFGRGADDLAFESKGPRTAAKPPPPAALRLDLARATPLTPSFPAVAVAGTHGALVIELPVLVAHDAATLPGPFDLVAEVLVDGKKVALQTHHVDPSTLMAGRPVLTYFKTLVPMPRPDATILVGVQQVAPTHTTKLFMTPVPRTW